MFELKRPAVPLLIRLLPILLFSLVIGACGHDDATQPPATGSVEVTAATTGSTLDSDGYTVTVDGGGGQSIGINGSTTFAGVAAGDREVELTGVASNCTVAGTNPRTVTVAGGGMASTSFDVTCAFALRNQIVFTSNRDGNNEIYVMNADGSGQANLTDDPDIDRNPAVSPDGTRIAFRTNRDVNAEIYVMDADGSDPVRLTTMGQSIFSSLAWSPDGTQMAFATERDENEEIYVMNADGSGQTNLTNDSSADRNPAWSPDGTQIAFETFRDGGGGTEIYVMDADGSNPINLTNTNDGDGQPAWSPDGTQIAFTSIRDGNHEIYVMDADGSNPERLTDDPAVDADPTWSPDGTRIAFRTTRDGDEEIYVMDADGSNPLNLTNAPGSIDRTPDWSPE